jgi:NAD dependent epimerase/dehydratase family enzyme
VAIRLLFGEMGQSLLLEGARVIPAKLRAAGFEFLHPRLEDALRRELGREAPELGGPS